MQEEIDRTDLLTFHLLAKALIEYSVTPTQNLKIVRQIAPLFNIPPKIAYATFFNLMKQRQEVIQLDQQLIEPKIEAFDQLLNPGFKYQAETQLANKVDMKGWDKVDVNHINAKTKNKRGIGDFVQIIETQRQSMQRKKLISIQQNLRSQLAAYATYLKDQIQ